MSDVDPTVVAWLKARPESVQRLLRDWPPGAVVKAKPGITLLVPAPGIEGTIYSYFENGKLGVLAPLSIPHPEHGWGTARPGEMVRAEVDPEQLEVVREDGLTRDQVQAALA